MFKTILRTLSAFSIVTITASAGFAQNTGDPVDCEASQNQNLPECKVDFSDWTDSFARPRHAEPETLTPHNEFLRGYSTWLGSQGTAKVTNWMYSRFNDPNFNLNTRVRGGMAAYKATHTNGAVHYYVGLLSGTNLGAPVTETRGVAVWHGRFQAISGDTTIAPRDIALNIDFGTARSIDAYLPALIGTNPFKITGTFNGQGVITGRVTHNASLTTDRNAQGGGGHLTGLIGQQGAVGTFVADAGGIYAGGFTVSPYAKDTVNIADWASSYGNQLSTDAFNPNLDNPQNQFLQGYDWGLSSLGVPVTNSNWMYVRSDVDFGDGVAAYRGRHANGAIHYYAGILGNTNLGRPLTQKRGTASWNGRFQVIAGAETLDARDFVLNITFNGAGTGSIRSLLPAVGTTDPFLIAGTFDEHGVITGTVDHSYWLRSGSSAEGSGATLTGLIGREDAVGAFVGYPGAIYAGGFVARPPADVVEYADWVNNLDTPLPALPDTATRRNQFLQGGATALDSTGVTVDDRGSLNLATSSASLDGDVADGVAFFSGTDGSKSTRYHYAGILSGTNLGSPITQTSGSANWHGRFGFMKNDSLYYTDFILTVDFTGTRTSAGDISTFIPRTSIEYNYPFKVIGTFDEDGIISGDVFHGADITANTDTTNVPDINSAQYLRVGHGTLTGLIGQQGAVGVFIGDNGNTGGDYSGGFVASSISPSLVVNFTDWVDSFGDTPPPASPDTATFQNQFLQGGATDLNSAGGIRVSDRSSLTLANVGGDAADGVAFFKAYSFQSPTLYFYAGLLSGTNLGRPLTDSSANGQWNGQIQIIDIGSVYHSDFTLTVNFGGTGAEAGNISTGIIGLGSYGESFKAIGTFDNNGVISGRVLYGFGITVNTDIDTTEALAQYPGTLTGLIGQQGAVGAFIADQSDSSYYTGGFVAAPASE